jgi:hypothetical protein
MDMRHPDDTLACAFCEAPVFEPPPDGLCVWCRAGFPPSYEAWIARAERAVRGA